MAMTTPEVVGPTLPAVEPGVLVSEMSSCSDVDEDCETREGRNLLNPWPNRGAFGRACLTLYTVP